MFTTSSFKNPFEVRSTSAMTAIRRSANWTLASKRRRATLQTETWMTLIRRPNATLERRPMKVVLWSIRKSEKSQIDPIRRSLPASNRRHTIWQTETLLRLKPDVSSTSKCYFRKTSNYSCFYGQFKSRKGVGATHLGRQQRRRTTFKRKPGKLPSDS